MSDILQLLQTLSEGYYIRQVITILCLYFIGLLFLKLCMKKTDSVWSYLLAYPMGLTLWGLLSFLLLVFGIPYRIPFLAGIFAVVFLLAGFLCQREEKIRFHRKDVMLFFAVLFLACLACSGIFSISITNDSVYYYSVYPQMIVKYGEYRKSFDVFLTDVGQTTALINCLPYFFGFEETFGIQHFMNFNFAGIFFTTVYETAAQALSKKKAVIAACAAMVLLFTSTPFLITIKWVLANIYFMEFLFLLFYLGGKCGHDREEWEKYRLVLCLFTAMLSMMRMEGGMMASLLLLYFSTLSYKDRDLICWYLLPVALTQMAYYGMLYLKLKIDPLYSFLDIKKALLMVALLAGLFFYFVFIRKKRFQKLFRCEKTVFLGGLLIGNAGLLFLNAERYLNNLVCFGKNIILQNGWGYFGFMILIFLLLLPKRDGEMDDSAFFCLGYILLTIAVCWARSGTLRVGIGDSGNRVMMQIVPFVVYAVAVRVIHVWKEELCDSYDMSR